MKLCLGMFHPSFRLPIIFLNILYIVFGVLCRYNWALGHDTDLGGEYESIYTKAI